jgi:hypothetical protein
VTEEEDTRVVAKGEGNMENVLVVKRRLLVIAAALVLAATVSSSMSDTAHARISLYEPCENPNIVNPEYGGCPAWLKK